MSKSRYYLFDCLKHQVEVKCPEIQIVCYNYLELCCIMRENRQILFKRYKKPMIISVELREKYQPHLLTLKKSQQDMKNYFIPSMYY